MAINQAAQAAASITRLGRRLDESAKLIEKMQCKMFRLLGRFAKASNYVKSVAYSAYQMWYLPDNDPDMEVTSGTVRKVCGDDLKCATGAKAVANVSDTYTQLASRSAAILDSQRASGSCHKTMDWRKFSNASKTAAPIFGVKVCLAPHAEPRLDPDPHSECIRSCTNLYLPRPFPWDEGRRKGVCAHWGSRAIWGGSVGPGAT